MRIDFSIRDRLMNRSMNTLGLCFQCGTCTATCPLTDASTSLVRRIIKYAQYGLVPSDEKILDFIWRCTTCGMCASSCPRGVDIPAIIRGYREILQEKRLIDPKITETLWRLYEAKNPWGYSSADLKKFRLSFKDLYSQPSERPDYVLYSCCSVVTDPISQRVARAIVKILRSLGYKVSVLDPMCCGHVIYDSGEVAFLEEYMSMISETLSRIEAPIIVYSPHSLYMFRKIYPELGLKPSVEIYHHTQILAELVSSGKLKTKSLEGSSVITYHDPCYLARYLRITEEPRQILENIPGARYVEMEHSRENTLCCGAGGGRIFSEESIRLARNRLREASDIKAGTLVSSCQFCLRMFIDEAKVYKTSLTEIIDVSEILSRLV